MKSKNFNKKTVTTIIIVLLLSVSFAYADSWTSSQPSHATLYADTITSKTDGSSVNIADTQGLFVTGDITTLGKVGIGTTNPSQKLDVLGYTVSNGLSLSRDNSNRFGLFLATPGDFNHAIYNDLSNIDGEGALDAAKWNTYGGLNIRVGQGVSKNSALFINSVGNVGIGTTNPGTPLTVHTATAGSAIRISTVDGASDDNAPLSWYVVSTGHETAAITGEYPNSGGGGYGRLIFKTRDAGTLAEKMRIDSSGNVGIGTTNPQNKLDVVGNQYFYQAYSDAQILAEATCTALKTNGGWTFAVRRDCSSSAPDCATLCASLTEGQAGTLSCFNSLHIYSNQPAESTGTLGLKTYRYNGCGGGCGPNYCCCGN